MSNEGAQSALAVEGRSANPIELLSINAELAEGLDNPELFSTTHDISLGANLSLTRDVVVQNEAFRVRIAAPPEWGAFLAIDANTREVIGTCAYKGAPADDGSVEIAYFTFPEFERRGFGTAMAHALFKRAALDNAVRVVTAHTLPESNASSRILSRIGFRCVGTVIDPEDGVVWRWERSVARAVPSS